MRLLVLGTGGMAANHVQNFAAIEGVEVVAAVDVDPQRVGDFAGIHRIPEAFTSLSEAVRWGGFDTATNVTPDRVHYATTLALLEAGKHVMCEKPLAENYRHADEMARAAEQSGLVTMVNLTYRNVAALQAARDLVLSGALGRILHVEASYLQSWLVSRIWGDWSSESKWLWRLSTRHGSNGVLGDVGIHILDFAGYAVDSGVERLSARLRTFDKAPGGRIDEYELDANDSFTMSVEFQNGAMGVIHASRWATGHVNDLRLRVHGDRGALEVIHTTGGTSLRVCQGDDVEAGIWTDMAAPPVPTNYQRFAAAVAGRATVEPGFRHAADLQRVIDTAVRSDAERRELSVGD
jgi:predicted dehydrogenase